MCFWPRISEISPEGLSHPLFNLPVSSCLFCIDEVSREKGPQYLGLFGMILLHCFVRDSPDALLTSFHQRISFLIGWFSYISWGPLKVLKHVFFNPMGFCFLSSLSWLRVISINCRETLIPSLHLDSIEILCRTCGNLE